MGVLWAARSARALVGVRVRVVKRCFSGRRAQRHLFIMPASTGEAAPMATETTPDTKKEETTGAAPAFKPASLRNMLPDSSI